jgi:hypothetical protein
LRQQGIGAFAASHPAWHPLHTAEYLNEPLRSAGVTTSPKAHSRHTAAAHVAVPEPKGTKAKSHIAPSASTIDAPVRVTRAAAAELLSKHFFQVSPRTLERWPVAWRRLNGKAHVDTKELFEVAEQMLTAATPLAGGQRGSMVDSREL